MGEDTRRVAVLEHILGQIEATAGDDQSHLIIQLEKMLEQETTFKDRNAALVVRLVALRTNAITVSYLAIDGFNAHSTCTVCLDRNFADLKSVLESKPWPSTNKPSMMDRKRSKRGTLISNEESNRQKTLSKHITKRN